MSFQIIPMAGEPWPILEIITTFIGHIVWPITLLALIWIFRNHLKNLFGKLSSIDASSTGISLRFEQEIDTAIEELLPVEEGPKFMSKSGVQIGQKEMEKEPQTPFHQIMELREKLSHNIFFKAQENNVSTKNKSSLDLSSELLNMGVISNSTSKHFKALINLTNASNENITKGQVNKVKLIYKNLNL